MPGFSRSFRLVNKQDFQAVFANGRKISHKNLLALYTANQQNHPRLGIIIKKQTIKLAVHRNRYRRLIRESFRNHKDAIKGLDIIVIMRSECSPNGNANFRDDIAYLWQTLSKK